MIATDLLRSPCCAAPLARPAEGTLTCESCAARFPVRPFGPDLMPPGHELRYARFPQWQAVQQSLAAWRARTWTGTTAAAARTDSTVKLAEAFVTWAGITGAVLDIGCGGGWLQRMMPGAIYHGLDPMPADQPYGFPFVRALADRLPFPADTFDTCCFFSSIDYAIDIEVTTTEARRVLKPGGLLAIATPIHLTKEVSGERLHHYRFLAGELDDLVLRGFHDVSTLVYQQNYHLIRARKAGAR